MSLSKDIRGFSLQITITVQLTVAKTHQGKIVLMDVKGNKVMERNYNFNTGINRAEVSLQHLTKGTYIAVVYNSNNVVTAAQKFLKR